NRRAENPRTHRIQSCGFCRWLHLVECVACLAQTAGRFEDDDGGHECRCIAVRWRAVLTLCILHFVAKRSDACRGRFVYESEGREVRIPDRTQLRRWQRYARRRAADL